MRGAPSTGRRAVDRPAGSLRRGPLLPLISTFIGDRRAATVVEFAILSPLFFSIVFSAFEAGLMYLKIAMVDDAMEVVSRKVYTGQTQGGMTRGEMIDTFCGHVDVVMRCEDNVTLEIRTITDPESFDPGDAICLHKNEFKQEEELPAFEDTGSGDMVFTRICITTDILVPSLRHLTFTGINVGLQLPESADGQYALTTVAIFRNEPF